MCSPIALTIASVGMQAVGKLSEASAASSAAKTNAQIAQVNAGIKEKAAADAVQRGADTAAIARQKSREATGKFRAAAGSSGFLADTGSNLDIQEQNAGVGEQNALLIQNNAEREAYGYKVGAMNDNMQADAFTRQAKSAMTNGLLSAGGTLVTGASNFGSGGGMFNNTGKTGAGMPWQQMGYRNPNGGFYY